MSGKKKLFERKIGKATNAKNNRAILILTEGEKTELNYFRGFNHKEADFYITTKCPRETGAKALLREMCKKDIEDVNYSSKWICFDDEHFKDYNEFLEIEKEAKENKIGLIHSNPCFEYWFLLHFEYTIRQFKNYNEVAEALKRHWPTYKKNSCTVYNDTKNKLQLAIDNAKKAYAEVLQNHDGKSLLCPFTNVHEFLEKEKITCGNLSTNKPLTLF